MDCACVVISCFGNFLLPSYWDSYGCWICASYRLLYCIDLHIASWPLGLRLHVYFVFFPGLSQIELACTSHDAPVRHPVNNHADLGHIHANALVHPDIGDIHHDEYDARMDDLPPYDHHGDQG